MGLKELPLVSIIITTRNSAFTIADCLKGIKGQNYSKEKIEVIVVDNNSSDETVAIAESFTDKIFFKGPERSAQRNLGIHNAEGKYILYLDSDMSLSEKVISECVDKCENGGFIALYIPERIIGKGFWIKARDFERTFYNATCIDAVRFVSKDKALEIGGFDEDLTGPEDWDFDRRIREAGEVGIIESSLYHNEGKFSLRRYFNKKTYYSKDIKEKYIKKWGKDDKILKKQLGFWYRYLGVFIENGKWKKLIKYPILAVSMYFLRIAVGINFLTATRRDTL